MAGRPRKRSVEDMLALAMRVFWSKGYASTSMNDLTTVLEVGPSSIYNSFGSKAELFESCILAYREQNGSFVSEALEQPEFSDAVTALLHRSVASYTRTDCPRGCAVLNTSSADETDPKIATFLQDLRRETLAVVERRVVQAIEDGQLPADTHPTGMARYVMALLQGASAQARDGATLEDLQALVDTSIRALVPSAT